jgi:hypothetical protein
MPPSSALGRNLNALDAMDLSKLNPRCFSLIPSWSVFPLVVVFLDLLARWLVFSLVDVVFLALAHGGEQGCCFSS